MTIMRLRVAVFLILLAASATALAFPALAGKEETLDQLIAEAASARPDDRPGLYIEIARQKAQAADKHYDAGEVEAANAALQDVTAYSKKATDAAISTGKKLKNVEITLRKMAEKFRDIKRTVAFDDQAPIQQTIDELETMRTDLLTAMFGKKKAK